MTNRSTPARSPAVLILWGNSLFWAVLAAACFALGSILADWFDLPRAVVWVLGGVLAVASVGISFLAARRATGSLPWLAIANVGTGALLWAVAPWMWGEFSTEGRWVVSAVANASLLIGLTQWLAWRRG
jgi:hypothetical protein